MDGEDVWLANVFCVDDLAILLDALIFKERRVLLFRKIQIFELLIADVAFEPSCDYFVREYTFVRYRYYRDFLVRIFFVVISLNLF